MDIPEISDFEFEGFEGFDDLDDWSISNASSDFTADTSVPHPVSGHSTQDIDTKCSDPDPDPDPDVDLSNRSHKRARKDSPKRTPHCTQLEHYKLQRPRIVKRDFRRDFPMMWTNVTNTGCYDFMMEHIRTFYSRDVAFRQRDLRPMDVLPTNPASSKSVNMSGVAGLAEFWHTSMTLAPDLVCKLKHSVLKVRSDGTSTIRCSFVLNGTKIVKLMSSQELQRIQSHADLKLDFIGPAYANNTEISATVAAVAAVAPTKAHAAIRAQNSDTFKRAQVRSSVGGVQSGGAVDAQVKDNKAASNVTTMTSAVNINSSSKHNLSSKLDSVTTQHTRPDNMREISTSQVFIPCSILKKMSAEDEQYNSLRFDNNAQLNLGMAFTAYTFAGIDNNGEIKELVVLAGDVSFLCSLEINFNADCKVDAVVLNYIT